jgi:hypothetical protein
MKVIVNTKLNVRNMPSTSGNVISTLNNNQQITVIASRTGSDGLWYQLESGGWACAKPKGSTASYLVQLQDLENKSNPLVSSTNQNSYQTPVTNNAPPLIPNVDGTAKTATGIDQIMVDMIQTEAVNSRSGNKISGTTRLFGIPHQFTAKTDLRTNGQLDIGRKYMETIISEAPIVTFIPGRPNYLPDVNKSEKDALNSLFNDNGHGSQDSKEILNQILGDNEDVKYFGFISDYYTYMRYVNLLCGASALMLGLDDSYGFKNGQDIVPYYKFDWTQFKFTKAMEYKNVGDRVFVNDNAKTSDNLFDRFIGELIGTAPNYVQFYVETNTSYNESGSSSTEKSKVEALFESAEGLAKEVSFLTGTGALKGLEQTKEDFANAVTSIADKFSNTDNFITRALRLGSQVIQGANIVFPEIWSDSNFSKTYNVTVNLVSPYGTKEALYLNIMVPLMHLLALALPRQTSANTYAAPFLVKAFARGWFNCEMGIVESITIDKAGSGEAWTVDGFPSEMKVTLSIKDLYGNLSMTKNTEIRQFFQNQSLIEFLAVVCGIDLLKPEIQLKADLIKTLAFGYVSGFPTRLYQEMITSLKTNFFQYWQDLTKFTKF